MTFQVEDTEVDPQLGYPSAYPNLCRHAHATGLPLPFTEGPPQRFLPYSPQADDFQHLKEWDTVFPVLAEREKESSTAQKFAEELWQQLDHLGNAGFDPAKFRVDPYGNVVYWNADPSSPLAWDIDHWFPRSRGGKTKLPNLRIVQWQAYLRKRNRLEFLVPWWDLQHGCSINQFLSAFAAKNADFRKRSFALFFEGGEDESVAREHVGECRPWPQQFREKKALCGLAAAAIVNVSKDNAEAGGQAASVSSKAPTSSDGSHILGTYPFGAILGSSPTQLWSAEEEEAVKRGVIKFGPGSWKEIKEDDSTLANRSAVQIKEKYRLMRAVSRNLGRESNGPGRNDLLGRQSAATTALQKELRVKIMREEEKREKEEELAQLEETVMKLKLENEKERIKSLELEALLKKQKHRVEKQRKWAESQSSYRLCLERVLRDTMHQTMSYKEQARLTREACNVLIACLDSQKASCEAMESDLLQRHAQRELLEAAAARVNGSKRTTLVQKKLVTQGRDIVDVSSCVSLRATDQEDDEEEEKLVMTANQLSGSDTGDEGEDEVYNLRREYQQAAARKSLVRHAIKVAMQVGNAKDSMDLSPWEAPPGVEAKTSCPDFFIDSTTGARLRGDVPQPHQRYEAGSETPESGSDSDFADDEMSPAIRLSSDGACKDNNVLVSELSQFHDGPTSELRDFCTRNSKPGLRALDMAGYDAFEHSQSPVAEPTLDISVPSAGESRSDSKREVQKDVIMVQTDSFKANADTAALSKQQYLDELLQQIRFQIPTSEAAGEAMADGPPWMSEGNLDELMEQVLATHLDKVRRNDARQHQSADADDEELKDIGKSNLDKWLQVLLFKDVESARSSPGRDAPLQTISPALSSISVAAMRKSLELASHQRRRECRKTEEPVGNLAEEAQREASAGAGKYGVRAQRRLRDRGRSAKSSNPAPRCGHQRRSEDASEDLSCHCPSFRAQP
uniref:Myb-like domain-containing protein n=1 Tax=Physcomitrium patens TaxID=3218 RepID=A0A7I4FD07_PHYPA